VTTWKQYKEFVQHHERLSKPVSKSHARVHFNHHNFLRMQPKGQSGPDPIARMPSEAGAGENAPSELNETLSPEFNKNDKTKSSPASSAASHANVSEEARQRAPSRAGGSEPFDKRDREEMEALLGELRGHLGK
jgi:phospholipase D1/2